MRNRLQSVALVLVGLSITAMAAYAFFTPQTMKIAVGPAGNADMRIVAAFAQALQREGATLRLKIVATDGPAASAKLFENGKVDLAVVRSDIAIPEQAATVAILRSDAAYFVTRPGSRIGKVSDLRGKNVGIIAPRPANELILQKILAHNGIAIAQINLVRGSQAEIAQGVSEGQLDAVFVVAPISDRMSRADFQGFPKLEGKEPEFLPVAGAEGIADQDPVFDAAEIVRGAFGGDPPRPDEATTTLAVTHRLVARRTADEVDISELTRLLFSLRLAIATEAPAANQIKLPTTEDRGAKLPTHAGTIAYVEGETKTFFERYGDWVYIGIMAISLIGSVAAALWSRMTGERVPVDIDRELRELVQLIEATRKVTTRGEFEDITKMADHVHADLIQAMVINEPDADRIATIQFLLSELREMLADRRTLLYAER